MAYDVKFLRGTSKAFGDIAAPDNKIFYYLTDTDELYLGSQLLSNHPEVETLKTTLSNYKDSNDKAVKAINDKLGEVDISALGATVTAAIAKLAEDIKSTGSAGEIAVTTETTTEGMAKSYTLTQGGKQVAVIDIPKDMVVSSGAVEANPEGQPAGTYLVLTLANATNDKIYINANSLVDTYTAVADAVEVQLAFDGYKVSASLVDGGISTAKLADDVVTTVKIADKAVTKAKLADVVQASLDKADSAVQTVVEGTVNGEILVDGAAVKVHGLGSAAFTNADAYDVKGAADAAKNELLGDETTPGAETVRGVKKAVEKEVSDREAAIEAETAARAELEAKVDTALGDGGNVATQIKNAIDKLDAVKDVTSAAYAVTGITQVDGVITEIREHDFATDIATAKQAAIDAAAADATSKADKALEDAQADATTKSNKALTDAKAYTDTEITTLKGTASSDAQDKADKALEDAKSYVDEAMTWGTF